MLFSTIHQMSAAPIRRLNPALRALVLPVLLLLMSSVHAADAESLRQSYDEAFQEMYKDVGDLDKTFRFAELAAQVGDLEGAIAALERMLLLDPNLPTVRMQLGVLYLRLESYGMAYAYLSEVRDDEQVPSEVREQAENLISQIDAAVSSHKLSSTLMAGVRYQSNANGGPLSGNILLFGESATLDDQYTQQADWDVNATGQFGYIYDFRTEPATTLNVDLSIYANRQNEQSEIDTKLLELKAGGGFLLSTDLEQSLELKPFLVANDLSLNSVGTFSGFGGGLTVSRRLSKTRSWNIEARYVERDYDDAAQAGLEGPRTRVTFSHTASISERMTGVVSAFAFDENAKDNFAAYRQYSLSGTLQRILDPPGVLSLQPWIGSLVLGYSDKAYQAASAAIDPNTIRSDGTLSTSASLTIPLWFNTALVTVIGYTDVDSNLPNYTNQNLFTSVSAMGQF
jgi:tetratricopeptide (TPR) repeat protein